MKHTFISRSEKETKAFASLLAHKLKRGDIVLLSGDLGAGKTTLVGGVLNELGYKDHVISPTFNILKCYFDVNPHVYHIDAYRLEDQNIDIGLEEYIEGDGVCFIEWPMFILPIIPKKNLQIIIKRIDDSTREITVESEYFNDLISTISQGAK